MKEENSRKGSTAKAKAAVDLVAENKKSFAKNLYKRIKFLDKQMDELEKKIKKEGAVVKGVNGNGFEVVQQNPAQKVYNEIAGKYNGLVKTLLELIPGDAAEADELLSFILRR